MKTYVIIGLSTFGYYMAQFLADRKFDVMVIDSNEQRVENVKHFVTKGIIANATDKKTLTTCGLDSADAVIVSLGESIDASLLAVMYLKELGIREIYVKVLTEEHAKIVKILGVTEIIFPERDSAYTIAQRIDNRDVLDYIPLLDGYSIIDLTPPDSFVGKTLQELDLRRELDVQVLIVRRQSGAVLIPKADLMIHEDDILVMMGKNEDIQALKKVK